MGQVNVNPEGRDTGVGTVLAVLLVLVLVAFLVWALAFGGFNTLAGSPATTGTSPSTSNPTVNINPNVNVNPPASNTGHPAPSGGTTAPAPAKP